MNPLYTTNSDGTDEDGIVMLTRPWEWISDMFYAGVELCGVLVLLAVGVAGLAFGLMKAGLV